MLKIPGFFSMCMPCKIKGFFRVWLSILYCYTFMKNNFFNRPSMHYILALSSSIAVFSVNHWKQKICYFYSIKYWVWDWFWFVHKSSVTRSALKYRNWATFICFCREYLLNPFLTAGFYFDCNWTGFPFILSFPKKPNCFYQLYKLSLVFLLSPYAYLNLCWLSDLNVVVKGFIFFHFIPFFILNLFAQGYNSEWEAALQLALWKN